LHGKRHFAEFGAVSSQAAGEFVAIRWANERLNECRMEPISERVSPHSLRRTYASMRAALRDDPVYIAEQLGHTDPGFTFRVYQRRRSVATGSPAPTLRRSIEPSGGREWETKLATTSTRM
jgi:integrase